MISEKHRSARVHWRLMLFALRKAEAMNVKERTLRKHREAEARAWKRLMKAAKVS
jgi:hypothetical protein